MTRIRHLFMMFFILSSAGLSAAEDGATTAIDPTGTWVWEQAFGSRKTKIELRLVLHNKTLNGTYKSIFPEGSRFRRGPREPIEISKAKLEGDEIYFHVVRKFGNREFTTTFSGVVAGDEIAGLTIVNFGGQDRESAWMAKRVVMIDDVVGKWNIKLETAQGEIEEAFSLSKSEEDSAKLEGTFHSSFFGDHPIKDIAIEGKRLNFVVEMEANGTKVLAEYKATLLGEKMGGLIAAIVNGEEMEIPFEGARVAMAKVESNVTRETEQTETTKTNQVSGTAFHGPSTDVVTSASPGRVPAPGRSNDLPYVPQPILPGGIVVPLYASNSTALNHDRIREAEK